MNDWVSILNSPSPSHSSCYLCYQGQETQHIPFSSFWQMWNLFCLTSTLHQNLDFLILSFAPSKISLVGFISFLRAEPKTGHIFHIKVFTVTDPIGKYIWVIYTQKSEKNIILSLFLNDTSRNKGIQCSYQIILGNSTAELYLKITEDIDTVFPIIYFLYNAPWILQEPILRLAAQSNFLPFTSSKD